MANMAELADRIGEIGAKVLEAEEGRAVLEARHERLTVRFEITPYEAAGRPDPLAAEGSPPPAVELVLVTPQDGSWDSSPALVSPDPRAVLAVAIRGLVL